MTKELYAVGMLINIAALSCIGLLVYYYIKLDKKNKSAKNDNT